MTENKLIGEIGEVYENRRTRKRGILIAEDNENKTLTFQIGADKTTIPYSAFRSVWRKATESTTAIENDPMLDVSEGFKLALFMDTVRRTRSVDITHVGEVTTIILDDMVVMSITENKLGYSLRMFADIYTQTDWKFTIIPNSTQFKITPDGMGVSTIVNCSYGDILQMIAEAVAVLNLYGYKIED